MRARKLAATILVVGLSVCARAQAGRSCEVRPPTPEGMTRGLALATRTQEALDASGARVVFVARSGQDLRKYGLRYSHMGIAYKRDPDGPWRVLHELNHCTEATSALYRQGLGDFFLDDPWRYETAWAVPSPVIQERLLALLFDDARATSLHDRHYNVVAYPWSTRYQQSNQWTIETLAAAMEPAIDSRERAQAWLKLKGYEPTTLRLGPLTRLGARITSANVAFDDHPNEKRFSDRIETASVDSVFAWLERTRMAGAPVRIALP
jgi:hypothetical protein